MLIRKLIFCLTVLLLSPNLFAKGTMQTMLFKDGLPFGGFKVIVDGKEQVFSDEDGLIVKALEEGKHFLEIQKGEEVESVAFVIVEGETTQVLINTLSEEQKFSADISEPTLRVKEDKNAPKGEISGTIYDDKGKALSGAKVFLTGVANTVTTDQSGRFTFTVPEGRYGLSVVHKAFSTQTLAGNTVLAGTKKNLAIKMLPTGLELEEFVVVAPHLKGSLASLIEVRRKATTVADVLGAEQMSKSGDSNAAASLSRVTGLTVVDGRFVYIRGLGERYSNVLLNGVSLPSPDPTRRVVQLDLFPSGILESMVIQKSYSPDLPGSFGGGAVNLKTKDIPEDFTAKVSLSTSYEDGQDQIITYQGGGKDWLGMDDGTRALPTVIADNTAPGQKLGQGEEERKAYSQAFKRNYSTSSERSNLPPSMSLSIGDTFRYRGKKLGFNLAGLYSDRLSNDDIERETFDVADRTTGELLKKGESRTLRSTRNINLSGMANLGLYLGKYADIRSNTLMLRATRNRVERISFSDQDNSFDGTNIEWQERQLFSQILNGKHQLGENKERLLTWTTSVSQANMDQPDARYFQLLTDDGNIRYDNSGKSNERVFGKVQDNVQQGEAALQLPLISSNILNFKTKFGAGGLNKKRESRYQRFKYEINPDAIVNSTGDETLRSQGPDALCTDEQIQLGNCYLVDTTVPTDRFEAKQTIRSYFLETETKVSNVARLNLGVRYENSRQDVATYEGDQSVLRGNSLVMKDYLPAAGLTFFVTDNMQFRLGYSETISRPDFKDLNPVGYYDDERDRTVKGNPLLNGTIIRNLDARWEWYFGNQENISVGVFDKEFSNPIEEVAGSYQNGKLTYSENGFQLFNVGDARVRGFEVEFRKNFSFIHSSLQPLAIGGNYAYIDSQMNIFPELAAQVTNTSRPLQGQSPYVVNVNLDYDNKDTGTGATLLFNVFGARIDSVGVNAAPDTYQESFNQLDFVFSQKFGENQKNNIRFKLQNILDPDAVLTMGDVTREVYKKGRRASLSYTRTF